MLTIHAAPLVLPVGAAPVPDGAVAVDGDRIAAIGPYGELAAAFPRGRVRRWPGVLTPGLRQWHACWLLTRAYHPDPREADALGTEPVTGDALAELAPALDESRWSGSVRRGLQRMLAHGTTHVAGPFPEPVRQAVIRSGLTEVPAAGAPDIPSTGPGPGLDPFAGCHDLPGGVHTPLRVGGRADLAAFDAPDEAALAERGAASCAATVLAGRLVHRTR
ncbi:imidazolonepropionase-like domain-containing protein [Streptomyces sp. O3]